MKSIFQNTSYRLTLCLQTTIVEACWVVRLFTTRYGQRAQMSKMDWDQFNHGSDHVAPRGVIRDKLSSDKLSLEI